MKKLEQLYEGKAKKVFATDDPNVVLVDYKDDATAFNGLKKGTIMGKGVINNRVTNFLMKMLEKNGIPTHYIEEISDRETLVKKVHIVPLEVIVRNIAAGSLSKRLGLPEGTKLKQTVLEYCYKDDELGDPMVNEYHIMAMGWVSKPVLDQIAAYALRINELLTAYLKEVNIELTSSWSSASRMTVSWCWRTKSARTPAASGIPARAKSWIKTASAAIWATWKTLTSKSASA